MAPSRLAWSAALLSWVIAVPLWFVTKYVLVIAHEGGHALLFKLFFRRLTSVRFDRYGGGVTTPTAKAPWLFDILITMAGYLGPSMFGLFGAWLLVRGQTTMVLWTSMAFLVLMLFAVRGILGWLTVPGLLVLLYLVTMRVDPPLQTLYAHMWVWFLLIGAVQRMLHFVLDRQYDSGSNDSAVLAGLTLVPSAIWAFVFLVGTIGALVYGGAMLLRI